MADEPNATTEPTTPVATEPVGSLISETPATEPTEASPEPKAEEPAAEAKTEEPSAKLDVEKLTLPEGVKLADGWQKDFGEVMAEAGVTDPELGQKLLNAYADRLTKVAGEPYRQWNDTQLDWQKTVKADPEIGGDKLASATLPTISKALDQFGDPEVRQALAFTGAGNNPAIIRTLFRMSKALTEGGHVAGSPASQPKGPGAHALYPNLPQG